jgi:hypothetical protein
MAATLGCPGVEGVLQEWLGGYIHQGMIYPSWSALRVAKPSNLAALRSRHQEALYSMDHYHVSSK